MVETFVTFVMLGLLDELDETVHASPDVFAADGVLAVHVVVLREGRNRAVQVLTDEPVDEDDGGILTAQIVIERNKTWDAEHLHGVNSFLTGAGDCPSLTIVRRETLVIDKEVVAHVVFPLIGYYTPTCRKVHS